MMDINLQNGIQGEWCQSLSSGSFSLGQGKGLGMRLQALESDDLQRLKARIGLHESWHLLLESQ